MNNVMSLVRQHPLRVVAIVALIAIAAFGIYRFAGGGDSQAQASAGSASTTLLASGSAGGAAGSCSCCAAGSSDNAAASTEGSAIISGATQKISVDLSSGRYDPSVLRLKAGVPAEVTFGQSSGCTRYVQSADLSFQADLRSGPQTIKLPGLQPGTYRFACGMNMVTGKIVVE